MFYKIHTTSKSYPVYRGTCDNWKYFYNYNSLIGTSRRYNRIAQRLVVGYRSDLNSNMKLYACNDTNVASIISSSIYDQVSMNYTLKCGNFNSSWWRVVQCNDIPNICVSHIQNWCDLNIIDFCSTEVVSMNTMISPCNIEYNQNIFIQKPHDDIPGNLFVFGISFINTLKAPMIQSISYLEYANQNNGMYDVMVHVLLDLYSASGIVSCTATTLDREHLYSDPHDILRNKHFLS